MLIITPENRTITDLVYYFQRPSIRKSYWLGWHLERAAVFPITIEDSPVIPLIAISIQPDSPHWFTFKSRVSPLHLAGPTLLISPLYPLTVELGEKLIKWS